MGKKPFLIPKILGVLFAVSVITVCDELPDLEITSIDLTKIELDSAKTPNDIDKEAKSAQYESTTTWSYYANASDYVAERIQDMPKDIKFGKITEKKTETKTGTETKTYDLTEALYEAKFTLKPNDGCFFNVPQGNIKFANYTDLHIDEEPTANLIVVTVVFPPVK
jgi:hypothetical protein